MPSTRPSIRFDKEGVCSACQWHQRKKYPSDGLEAFKKYISKNKINKNYDCIIPVSGGKDSTYQVWRVLQSGFNPLCVTAPTDYLTPIGRENIENIKRMGVDHIEVNVNLEARRIANRYCLENIGDIQWPEHVLIFTVPVHIAAQFNIPVIIWGENSVREYGAGRPEDEEKGVLFTREYLEENCGFNGLRVSDMSESMNIDEKHLFFYRYPDEDVIQKVGIKGLFLDDFFPWNGMTNQLIAKSCGFSSVNSNILGTLTNYENLDNYYHGIHDYIKYLKYGYGRATDVACNWIRRGLISRSDALELVRSHDGLYPSKYIDLDLNDILKTINMDIDEFNSLCDMYTNYSLFKTDSGGNLVKRVDGSPELVNSYRIP